MILERRLRIAMVCPFGLRPKATASARALPMAAALCARGHDARLFLPPWDDPDAPTQNTCQLQSGVNVWQAGRRGPVPMFGGLARQVLAFRPDVIHVFKPIGYSGAFAMLAEARRAFGSGCPWLLDMDDWEGPGGWADVLGYPGWKRRMVTWQENWCLRRAGAVTVASEALRILAWGQGGAPERVWHVPNGLGRPLDRPAREDVEAKRASLGLSGPSVLLYTRFAEFPPEWPVAFLARLRGLVAGIRLLVVGEGLHGEEARLLAAARAAGLGSEIIVAGWVAPADLPPLVCSASLAIVPFADSLVSRTKSSVKLLELMSLGMPVLASALGENILYLGNGTAGRLLEGLDADVWAHAAAGVLGDAAERSRLGEAARRRVREHYLWSHLVERVESAYAFVLGR